MSDIPAYVPIVLMCKKCAWSAQIKAVTLQKNGDVYLEMKPSILAHDKCDGEMGLFAEIGYR